MANTYVLFTDNEGALDLVGVSSWVNSLLAGEPVGYAPSMGWILDVEYPIQFLLTHSPAQIIPISPTTSRLMTVKLMLSSSPSKALLLHSLLS